MRPLTIAVLMDLPPDHRYHRATLAALTHVSMVESWKRAFDSDPVGRERSGVRRYTALRGVDDPNLVMIDLEFDTKHEAEGLLAPMKKVWGSADHRVTSHQQARIVEVV